MPLRPLLLAAAVPLAAEEERQARRLPALHLLLRWDRLLSTVLAHCTPPPQDRTAASRAGEDDAELATMEDQQGAFPRMKKGSAPSSLPDIVITSPALDTSPQLSPLPSPSPTENPSSSNLHLRLVHIQSVRQISRKEGHVTRPDPLHLSVPPAACPEPLRRRVSAPARPQSFAARLRKISVTDTLRQVGQDLQRIADHLQLSRLMGGGRPVDEAEVAEDRSGGGWLPAISGAIGCAIVCGITALLGRAFRH